jgi:hypothetical protein
VYDGEQRAKLAVDDDERRCGGGKILALDSVVVSILFFFRTNAASDHFLAFMVQHGLSPVHTSFVYTLCKLSPHTLDLHPVTRLIGMHF